VISECLWLVGEILVAPARARRHLRGGENKELAAPLRGGEVADILQVARVRILRYLQHRAIICVAPEAITINDELLERDPAIAQPAAAAVSGLPPAGPALRAKSRVLLPLPNRPATARFSLRPYGLLLGLWRRRPYGTQHLQL
jgi:hypothetical protein